jgi:hypothetical protein
MEKNIRFFLKRIIRKDILCEGKWEEWKASSVV